ncbi:MAG TPA: hypothetical protein VI391_06885 [Thermoanaerobaculia bacterium]
MFRSLSIAFTLVATVACAQPFSGESIPIAHDGKGIGFDDLGYSRSLQRVLVPAGRTGSIVLIDPANHSTTAITGLSREESYGGGHGEGTTSVDEGGGALYATDRTAQEVVVIDPVSRAITARARLASGPDYVRYVAPTGELWVTEPDSGRIEIFTLSPLKHAGFITVAGGPESLIIDAAGGRAFTHLWDGASVAIDIHSRQITSKWPNRCGGSRGIAFDAKSQFLFAACTEGKAVVMDVAHGGKVLATARSGRGVDIIDYDPVRRHLYFPAARSATLTIFNVGANGALTAVSTTPIVQGSHCVTTDGKDAYVCDPNGGRILIVHDNK